MIIIGCWPFRLTACMINGGVYMGGTLIWEKISHVIDKIVGYICIVFAITMTVTTLVGILFRYVMTNPLPWTEELARYAMIWMGLLAISMGVKRQSHLGLKLFVNMLPKVAQKILSYIIRIIIGYFLYMLIIYGTDMALNGVYQIAPALQIKMVYVLSAVPVAAALSLTQLVLITAADIHSFFRTRNSGYLSEGSGL